MSVVLMCTMGDWVTIRYRLGKRGIIFKFELRVCSVLPFAPCWPVCSVRRIYFILPQRPMFPLYFLGFCRISATHLLQIGGTRGTHAHEASRLMAVGLPAGVRSRLSFNWQLPKYVRYTDVPTVESLYHCHQLVTTESDPPLVHDSEANLRFKASPGVWSNIHNTVKSPSADRVLVRRLPWFQSLPWLISVLYSWFSCNRRTCKTVECWIFFSQTNILSFLSLVDNNAHSCGMVKFCESAVVDVELHVLLLCHFFRRS